MVQSIAANTAAAAPGMASSRAGIADNFETFLLLLTTQLQNQNPLEPLDTNQFTQQLVQFSSVEQQLKTNDFLSAMLAASQTNQASQAVSYIGKTVMSAGTQAEMNNGRAVWSFVASAEAPDTIVTIRDEAGSVVYRQRAALTAGADQLVWDGTMLDGSTRTAGKFTISIDARAGDGSYVPVTTEVGGMVSAVDLSGGEPVLVVNGTRIPLSQVTSVEAAAAA